MADRMDVSEELNSVRYADFSKITAKMQTLSEQYSYLPLESLFTAFSHVGIGNPFVQNRRIKTIATSPNGYSKKEIEDMLADPDYSELPLRQTEKSLEYSSYPLFHIRTVYQNLLTYHSFIAPYLSNDEDSDKDNFWREWKLLEKLRTEMDTKANARMIAGQALQEGKVFYYPRISIDKSHNKVNYAFMQQLPSDWVKITGYNNKSKYTLSFNMMYFCKAGTDVRQFGDLFADYVEDFNDSLYPRPTYQDGKICYGSNTRIDLAKVGEKNRKGINAYRQNGGWFYWVELPVDKVFTFEVDPVNRNVFSPFTGLFIDLLQLVSYEKVQLELVQNPLISIVLGEIPYFEDKVTNNNSDQYKLSNAGLKLFQAMWEQMLADNNTGGIGFFAGPFENMKLQQLAEAPSALNISSNGYGYTLSKAGLSGIIPVDKDSRAGVANISFLIESRFAIGIYECFERMFNTLIDRFNLKYSWRFHMFGTLATDKDEIEETRQGMTLGLLTSTMRYLALKDMSLFDDISISDAIIASRILEKRIPLQSTYNASTPTDTESKSGRPKSEDNPTSDGNEQDQDSYSETRFN